MGQAKHRPLQKRLRPVVQFGDLYRLESPYEGARASLLYTRDNTAVVFAYQVQDSTDMARQPLKLAGLDASRRYKVEEVNLPAGTASTCPQHGKTLTGASLMNDGLSLSLTKTLQSSVFVLTAE
ncbi:MAG: GH36 C-terminal domain-containing protein [Puniceicoccales bacterium]|nr:GH36 C-terminal domain-containing protein [Puniceicoccales bacterium]